MAFFFLLFFPVNKREATLAHNSPKRTTNGKTGDVKNEWQGGGATTRRAVPAKRDWQLEEPVDTPPDTVLAVYRSSVPASARASLGPAPNKNSSNSISPNGSLLNGGSHKAPAVAHEIEMQMVRGSDITTGFVVVSFFSVLHFRLCRV